MVRLVFPLSLAFAANSAYASAHAEPPSPTAPPETTASDSSSYLVAHFGAGVAAGVVVVPATLAAATWLGTTSSNLYAAGIPALLLVALLPPAAMTLAQWWSGNWLDEESATVHPAIWVAAGVHLAVLTGAILLGASTRDFGDATAFVAVDALAVPAAVTLTMRLSRPERGGTASHSPQGHTPQIGNAQSIVPIDPLGPPRLLVPVLSVAF